MHLSATQLTSQSEASIWYQHSTSKPWDMLIKSSETFKDACCDIFGACHGLCLSSSSSAMPWQNQDFSCAHSISGYFRPDTMWGHDAATGTSPV